MKVCGVTLAEYVLTPKYEFELSDERRTTGEDRDPTALSLIYPALSPTFFISLKLSLSSEC